MKTPIYDFVSEYTRNEWTRFHMPGHKGKNILGCEDRDLTEIAKADDLYHPEGIILQSERNAASLFGSGETHFSTEGSSQCIRAMLFLAVSDSEEKPLVLAARNVHKAFVYSAALLDFDVEWLYPSESDSLCSCVISHNQLEEALLKSKRRVSAVYITSPDYLGNIADVKGLAELCHRYGTMLLVDNAHGAYLRFLNPSQHPMDLGADICCDSAHKTLPALTGTAYLHIHKRHKGKWDVKRAMEIFGSTSPSYLLMQSLDLVNCYLANGYERKLQETLAISEKTKASLRGNKWLIADSDPLRITFEAARSGWDGRELAEYLRSGKMECEYADPDFVVLMITPETEVSDFEKLVSHLGRNDRELQPGYKMPVICPERGMSVRDALFSKHELVPVSQAVGRICGAPTVSCPPAIPVVISGEVIGEEAAATLRHYGISCVEVIQ